MDTCDLDVNLITVKCITKSLHSAGDLVAVVENDTCSNVPVNGLRVVWAECMEIMEHAGMHVGMHIYSVCQTLLGLPSVTEIQSYLVPLCLVYDLPSYKTIFCCFSLIEGGSFELVIYSWADLGCQKYRPSQE